MGKGDLVFILGNLDHGIRNVGRGELWWLYSFAANRLEDVVYRFSEKRAKL